MSNNGLVERIQNALRDNSVPAWLFYGFHEIDPIAIRILAFSRHYHATRRWFYLVPAQGEPVKLVHRIESGQLDHLPGEKRIYLQWQQLEEQLKALLSGTSQVAMQYSSIPYCSRVDAGTVDSVRQCGVEVVSSENLTQPFEAVWRPHQLAGHRRAGELLTATAQAAFEMVADALRASKEVREQDVQDFIMDRFAAQSLVTDAPPIVGVQAHSGDPHYSPPPGNSALIGKENFLLIDLWAKEKDRDSVFADITWTAYLGKTVPARVQQVFDTVVRSRERGFELLQERFGAGQPVQGFEVDDAVREVIEKAGYGEYFVHRTGHNLGEETHGNGVHFDNLETHDTRLVIEGIGCTIEPGIYLPEFGVRSEINVYMAPGGPEITTPPQSKLLVHDV